MSMPHKAIILVSLIVVATVAVYFLYPRIEHSVIFFPSRSLDGTPGLHGLTHKEVYFETADGQRLHGWFFPIEEESPVILFCHGNAGNISHRLENIKLLLERRLRVFIFDYRGYGKSTGRPSEKGLYQDGLAAYDYVTRREQIAPDAVIPFGRSLGATVALEIALQRTVKSIIIEGAFTSTKEMARTIPVFYPLSFIAPPHYNSAEKIRRINVPILVVHAQRDEIVPCSMGERLFACAKKPKFFYPVEGATHNDTYVVGGGRYFETLAVFAYQSQI